jgi:hypothetical protein
MAFPVWARKNVPLDHWQWKYLNTPLGTDVVVAVSEGKIIGVTHNILLHLKLGPSVVLTHLGADSTTHQNYRGIGVFGAILNLIEKIRIEKKVRLEYAISGNPIVRKEWGKRGRLPFPHPVSYMVRIRDVRLHLTMRPMENAAILSSIHSVLKNLNRIIRALKFSSKPKDDFEVIQIQSFDDNNDTFWEEIKPQYNFILDKSSKFLNWRYCDSRAGNFIIKKAVKDGKVLGYIVTELVKDEKYNEGFIVDLLALTERLDVADALLKDACAYFDGLGVNVIYYMVVKGHTYQRISSYNGFIDSRRIPYITCHILDTKNEFETLKASPPSQSYFSYADLF